MEYAVFKSGGKQYRVAPGDTITIDRLSSSEKTISFGEVLLWVSTSGIKVGSPLLSGVSIRGQIVEHNKGEKIDVSKFKAKARHRRTIGFRAFQTIVKIDEIVSAGKSAVYKEKVKKEEKKATRKKHGT